MSLVGLLGRGRAARWRGRRTRHRARGSRPRTGCSSISPGLQFKPGELEARSTPEQPIAIVPITPKILVEQAEARGRAATGAPKDPLAAEAASWQYRIAPYDVLSVIVWDHPELTIPAGEFREAETFGNAVQADGTMFYPHVGVIQVAGKTLPEVRVLIAERLRRVIENPQLDVRIAAFRGQRIEVTGEVVQPSTLPITDVPLRVQDAIAAARGLTPNAWTRERRAHPRRPQVTGSTCRRFYDEGDASQNWLLQDGDVVHVPSREENKVFVLGEVRMPVVEAHGARADEPRRGDRRLRGLRPDHLEAERRLRVPRPLRGAAGLPAERLERRGDAARHALPARAARRRLRRALRPHQLEPHRDADPPHDPGDLADRRSRRPRRA